MWLILWRVVQAVGGAMLMANSTAILTDAFPLRPARHGAGHQPGRRRSPGRFLGLVLGGVLAEWDWRAVFWVSVPVGVVGAVWSLPLAARGRRAAPGRARLAGQPDLRRSAWVRCSPASPTASSRTAATRWAGPTPGCSPGSSAGSRCSSAFCVVETRVEDPMFHIGPVPDPGVRRRQPRRPARRDRRAAACSSC